MTPVWLNPECRDGKHRNCGGDAWNDDVDKQVLCECECHQEEE